MYEQRLYQLYGRFKAGECSSEELQELSYLCLMKEHEPVLEQLWEQTWQAGEAEDITPVIRTVWYRRGWLVAAVLVGLLVVGWWLLVRSPGSEVGGQGSEVGGPGTEVVDVLAPAINKAMVTLSDGRMVSLDSIQNGLLADQGGVQLVKQADGQIQYLPHPHPLSTSGEGGGVGVMNTLTNPRGSKVIDLTLSDGTRVWLNAGSSITYPVVFGGNERRVSIKGEGYFEVTKNKTKPFYVQLPSPRSGEGAGGEVMVLGTHFNVNAYDDEPDIRVTLLEGLVKVSRSARNEATDAAAPQNSPRTPREIILAPGQQAIANSQKLIANSSPDLEQVMAWKNDRFQFNNANIETIMKQVARWYDVEVEYQGQINKTFRGGMPRSLSAASVFRILEETGGVHFEIKGNKIIVKP